MIAFSDMHKTGDMKDGKYFLGRRKRADGTIYEYWVNKEAFLKMKGADWFERRAKMDMNVRNRAQAKLGAPARAAQRKAYWDETREDRQAARKKRRAEAAKKKYSQRRLCPEFLDKKRKYDRERKAKQMATAEGKAKAAAANRKHYLKKTAEARAERERVRAERLEAKRLAVESRKQRMAEVREKKERERKMRPKRIFLTEEQRKERRRQEKRNYRHRRRARLAGQSGKATAGQVRAAKKKAGGLCFYCKAKVKDLTIDHVTPLARGGSHTLDNIVFACHECNSKKRDLPPHEFASRFGLLLV